MPAGKGAEKGGADAAGRVQAGADGGGRRDAAMMTLDEAFIRQVLNNNTSDMMTKCTWDFFREQIRILLAGYEAASPRLLTLREMQCYSTRPIIWVEFPGRNGMGMWHNTNEVINLWAHPEIPRSSFYGITWRCWSDKPSEYISSSIPWKRDPESGREE